MTTLDKLQEIITIDTLRNDGVPSASVAILQDGKITARVVTNHRDDTDTVYQACSISKAITAVAVAKMVDVGHFTYDTLVAQHLPESTLAHLAGPGSANWIEQVTVRMLVSHTSGLSQGGFHGYVHHPPTAECIVSGKAPSNTPRIRFDTFPGAQFNYSGGGFTVLQIFLETIMEKDFATLMISMETCHVMKQNYAIAYKTADVVANAPYHKFAELAAGGLWTTPSDLLKAISAVQQSLPCTSGFLKQDTAKEMLTSISQPGSDGARRMALGWGSDDNVFAHRGMNFPGYHCYAFGSHGGVVNSDGSNPVKVPAGNGIAVMTNGELGWDVATKIVSAIYHLKGWQRFRSLPSMYGEDDYIPAMALSSISLDSDWKDWCGDWEGMWALLNAEGPAISFKGSEPVPLRLAAAPVSLLSNGMAEHMFVAEHVRVAVRLTWDEEDRVLEIIQANSKTEHRNQQKK
ncbi:hypothetical protein LTR78_005679 [Recurvomyces mirabilis]|uniref:Beta-lactamase-related domain-containing protein n=1 Tax=Recurvomyces mirabilis TaxID=574656 RepID=A0AAE1C1H2_9PEZI|nr:hypothetical protein LTR78_005679 [Recurvomyces mirabilis]KAK5151198.1 hypothetical protein LTS14_009368 [Recurvomyces mirabilis]